MHPEEDTANWSDAQIWDELQKRVEGTELKQGPIFQKDVLKFRSYVCETMQYGRMFLAFADVLVLTEAFAAFFDNGSTENLDGYSETALRRIWRGQNFSYWMTSMLHSTPDEHPFDRQRRYGELESVTSSVAGQTYLAEAYTGWPFDVGYK